MKRTMKWQKTLTLKQLRHMEEWQSSFTLRAFKDQRKKQKVMAVPCWDCVEIERRLVLAGAMKETT